jgi:hypothetical protein
MQHQRLTLVLVTPILCSEGKGRANFKIEQWAHKHGMTTPLAATHFIAKNQS